MSKFICFCIIFCSIFLAVRSTCGDLERYVIIKSQASEFVLQGRDFTVYIEYATNATNQQWMFIPSKALGLFNIINREYGALDVGPYLDDFNTNITALAPLTDSLNQQWYVNSEGTIINNGVIGYALDIPSSEYVAGSQVVIWYRYDDTDFRNEKFSLLYD